MTHLRIELNELAYNLSARELVSSALIKKLYDIVTDPNNVFDEFSHLKGFLHVDATYQEYIDALTDNAKDLTKDMDITATKIYLRFEDPVVENYFLHTYNSNNGIGDGTGITLADLQSITSLGSLIFWLNTSITSLNDLRYFTNATSINGRFAREATNLVSVTTPSSLITLSDPQGSDTAFMGAFHGCSNLSNVTLNEGLTTIMCGAFRNCTSLLAIHLPSTVIYLGQGTETDVRKGFLIFTGCTTLQTITGGANVIQLGGGTFQDCALLTSIGDIDLSLVTFIGDNCFYNCQNLELGSVSNSYKTSIPAGGMFFNCKKLTSINLPNVTSIGDANNWQGHGNFRGCTALTSVTLSPNLTTIGSYAFNGDSALVNISPISPTVIKAFAFAGCPFPSTNLDLSNTTEIGQTAFYGCTGLTSIDLSSLTTVGGGLNNGVFLGCTGLTTVTNLNNASGTYMFYGCTGLTNVTLTLNATEIGSAAFAGCHNLTSIDLSNVTQISNNAFQGCTSLTSIDLSNVTMFGGEAFRGCTNLGSGETIEITHTGTSMPYGLLYGANYIGLILHIPNVTSWDNRYPLQHGLSSLQYFDASDCKITSIGSWYGTGNSVITYIVPSSVTFMDYRFAESLNQLLNLIMLSETPPTIGNTVYMLNNDAYGSNGGNANVYVKNSTVRDAYLADSNWGSIPNASTRIKTLAELPVGVWKTGLYQLYEPYLSNSSDPAYATT